MISVYYLVLVLPYEAKSNNFLNIFNEVVSVDVAIFIAMANAMADQPIIAYQIGYFIVWTLYFSWATNFIFVMFLILKELFYKIRWYYYKKLRFKFACLRPK